MTDYPPLTSPEEFPLHSPAIPSDNYWACTQPERPFEFNTTWYDWRCRACVRHAEATMTNVGPHLVMYWSATPDGIERNKVTLGWLVARSKHYLEMR